jgi:capsular polysaccharide biosynthesis protein
VSDEEEGRPRHRQDQAGSRLTAPPADPWPPSVDPSLSQDEDMMGRIWALGRLDEVTDSPADEVTGELVSLGLIRAAVWRTRWIWCATGVIGLLIGLAGFKELPPSYQASTTILLANNPFEQAGDAVLDDQAIMQSRTVAGAALRKLGIHEDPGTFAGHYTTTVLTNRLLSVTVKATSYPIAIREANAVAAAFLAFQRGQALMLEALDNSSLAQSVSAAKKNVASITARITSLSSQPDSPAKHTGLDRLLAQRAEANADLHVLEQSNRSSEASLKIDTAALINGSHVLDPAGALPQHAKRYLVLYAGGGLVAGLALSLSVIIIRTLVSDRLRRRDDVARALGAPVKLSVGNVSQSRWRRGRQGLAAARSPDIRRIVAHLDGAVPEVSRGTAALAVVPVDDPGAAALALASLAVSCAKEGSQVALADLCDGSPAARLLGFTGPGAQTVRVDGAQLLVAVPDPGDVAPPGPLQRQPRRAQPDDSLATACASADILLTLARVGPLLGADYLAGWTRRAVAVVTAGRPSAARVQAAGELIRLAGIELASGVLVGADKADESIGVTEPARPAPIGPGPG